jgi:hypothetical protein
MSRSSRELIMRTIWGDLIAAIVIASVLIVMMLCMPGGKELLLEWWGRHI